MSSEFILLLNESVVNKLVEYKNIVIAVEFRLHHQIAILFNLNSVVECKYRFSINQVV
jgi:hypothetical protein